MASPFSPTILVRTPWGHDLAVFADDASHMPGFLDTGRSWAHEASILERLLDPGMLAIDCGAEYGYLTSLFAHRVGPSGHVVSLEPEPSNFGLLKSNVVANSLDNVELHRSAVSDVEGTRQLWTSSTNLACHSLHEANVPNRIASTTVPCTTLDALYHSIGGLQIDLLKIDIEGHEGHALVGARDVLPAVRFLWLEFWPQGIAASGMDPEAVLGALFERFSFEMHNLLTGDQEPAQLPSDVIERCEQISRELVATPLLYPIVYLLGTNKAVPG